MNDAEFLDELKRRVAAATTTFLSDFEISRLRNLTARTRYFPHVMGTDGQFFSSTDIAGEIAIARTVFALRVKQRLLGKI